MVRKKIPLLYSLLFLFVLFIGSTFIAHYRGTLNSQFKHEKKRFVVKASNEAVQAMKREGIKKTVNITLDRLNDGQYAAGCFKAVPNQIDFLYGKTYKMIPWIPVPRVVYPKRIPFAANYNTIIARPPVARTVAPVTAVGEAYINFGWAGIPVVFLLLGFVYRLMSSAFRTQLSFSEAAIWVFFCVMTLTMTVNPAVAHLSWMLKILILLLACRFIEAKMWKRKHT